MADFHRVRVLVLGCGNILFGDDGFGPAVIEYLQQNYQLPDDVALLDAGTSVRNILFDVALSHQRPQRIVIVDGVDTGKRPGQVFELSVDQLPVNKTDDFSFHQLPTSNLLRELAESCHVEIRIVCAQVEHIPEEIRPGFSRPVIAAIPEACEVIARLCTNGESSNR